MLVIWFVCYSLLGPYILLSYLYFIWSIIIILHFLNSLHLFSFFISLDVFLLLRRHLNCSLGPCIWRVLRVRYKESLMNRTYTVLLVSSLSCIPIYLLLNLLFLNSFCSTILARTIKRRWYYIFLLFFFFTCLTSYIISEYTGCL